VELIQAHGLRVDDATHYSGIGTSSTTVQAAARGRFSNVAEELGLLGQRLGWAAKGIWTALSAMQSPPGCRFRQGALTLCWRFSHRARAFRRDIDQRRRPAEHEQLFALLRRALVQLGNMGLMIRGAPPLLVKTHL
jgi:hypothetical protein